MAEPIYYRPYLPSDSELSDSDYESDTTTSLPRPENALDDYIDPRIEVPDFKTFAQSLNAPLAGPTFFTSEEEIAFANPRIDARTNVYPYLPGSEVSGDSTDVITDVNSIVVLQSKNRDRSIYPLPTACQLFLPRPYRKVTGFSIAQINLTSSFFYFSKLKNNIEISIYEKDRIVYSPQSKPVLDASGNQLPLILNNYIREGSYDIASLLNELQLQLNRVPLFYDFPNGFSDFLSLFPVGGDYSLGFNYPGDYYYDAVKKIYIKNPTRLQITTKYFQTQYSTQFTFTANEILVAYYYPVLKEFLLDPESDITALAGNLQVNHILYNFTGLDDAIVSATINANIPILDAYRLQHTFRYSLVNRYICSYTPANNTVTIQSSTLNSSLVNLLNTQYAVYLSQQLGKYGISAETYNSLASINTQLLSIIQTMYDYLQINFATYFAVNYGTYSRAYYADPINTVFIRDGLDASGVAIRYDATLTPPSQYPIDTNISGLYGGLRNNPPYIWPRMKNIQTEGAQRNMGSTSKPFPESSNYPYNLSISDIDLTRNFIDYQGNIYTDSRRSAGDILANIDAGKYTIFQFKSKYRQTLQIETLPRQTQWRYPEWNHTHDVRYPLSNLFDISYSYISPSESALSNITPYDIVYTPLPSIQSKFSISFDDSLALWSLNYSEINISASNGQFYTFITPYPPLQPNGSQYTYTLNVTFITVNNQPVTSDFCAFLYHDIGAFSADLAIPRNESPIHYKYRIDMISSITSSNTISFTSYANQQYYILFRPTGNSPNLNQYRIVLWFPNSNVYTTLTSQTNFNPLKDPLTMLSNFNVAKVADSNYIRLPIQSNLWSYSPEDAIINTDLINYYITPIGYDNSWVSNDLTDYFPFSQNNGSNPINPTTSIRIDPINNYIFQYTSAYDDVSNSYFYSGSSNYLLTPYAYNQYVFQGTDVRQYKIVHFYATTYIQDFSGSYSSSDISPYVEPYTPSTTSNSPLLGFKYSYTPFSSQPALQLGSGVCGFTFIPSSGSWAIDRITFKTNFINPNAGTNSNIHALGVFYTSEISEHRISEANLANALAICLRTGTNTYTPNNLNIGADSSLGTYHTFTNSTLVTNTSVISGFNENVKQFIPDTNSYYSVVAFTFPSYQGSNWDVSTIDLSVLFTQLSNAQVYYIQNLMGSPIAYPFANTAYPSLTYYDGQYNQNGQAMALSTSNGNSIYGPSSNADESMSRYEQSIPIVNTNIHYITPQDIVFDPIGFSAWSNLPIQPSYVHASIPNYLLLQNGNFVLTTYSNSVSSRVPYIKGHLTIQQIYPDHENTSLLAVSGNLSNYCFLGAKLLTPTTSQLIFKLYNPSRGDIVQLPTNSNYIFNTSLLVQHFVFNNTQSWFLSSVDVPNGNIVLQGDTSYTNSNTMISYTYIGTNSELSMDPSSTNLYFVPFTQGFSNIMLFSIQAQDSNYIRGQTEITIELLFGQGFLKYYNQFCVTGEDILLLNTDVTPYVYYKIGAYYPTQTPLLSNARMDESVQIFTDLAGIPIVPKRILGGSSGSKWCMFTDAPYLMGNRNDSYDAPPSLNIASQILFPTIKIELRRIGPQPSPILDLTKLTYPEWPHTAMFAYDNYASLQKDILGDGGINIPKWGNESNANFIASDVSFNGFYFNSYCMDVPLEPNSTGDSNTDYYIAIRGWLPTENFQTMVRFYLPNKYDFGFTKLVDISNEVLLAQTIPEEFNPSYLKAILAFNKNFTFTQKTFGANPIQGFTGSNINSCNFGDFISIYKNLYTTFTSNVAILSNIQANLKGQIAAFISSDLKYILPPASLLAQRYTDPVIFQILWKSILTPEYLKLDDDWGLGWNLGYSKEDTDFSTIHTGSSFYKIQEDFIYLRLNPEFNINRMDSGGKEDYKQSRESSGKTNQYYCKLLLTSFGGNATTFIHNPIIFPHPLNSLTKLAFQWVDSRGAIISNNDSEWDMTVNIVESINIVAPIPRPAINPIITETQELAGTFPDAVLPDTALSTIMSRSSVNTDKRSLSSIETRKLKDLLAEVLRRFPNEVVTNDPSDDSS